MRCGLRTELVQESAVVSVRGDLDVESASAFAQELSSAVAHRKAKTVVVDLAECHLLDPAAVDALIATNRLLGYPRDRVTLVVDDPRLVRTIKLNGLDYVFTIHPSRAAAGLQRVARGV